MTKSFFSKPYEMSARRHAHADVIAKGDHLAPRTQQAQNLFEPRFLKGDRERRPRQAANDTVDTVHVVAAADLSQVYNIADFHLPSGELPTPFFGKGGIQLHGEKSSLLIEAREQGLGKGTRARAQFYNRFGR